MKTDNRDAIDFANAPLAPKAFAEEPVGRLFRRMIAPTLITYRATLFTLLRGFVIVIPTFIILPELIGNIGMWLAIPVAELITLLLISITTISKKRINHIS